VSTAFTGGLLLLINHYYYSWMGALAYKAGFCEYKRIYVPVDNGYPIDLTFLMDLDEVNSTLLLNPNYEVIYRRPTFLSISRVYDGVRYSLVFDNYRRGTVTTLNADMYQRNPGELEGERFATPVYTIDRRVSEIIADLPLPQGQKIEIASHIRVCCQFHIKLF
jgi:hypothetical protein